MVTARLSPAILTFRFIATITHPCRNRHRIIKKVRFSQSLIKVCLYATKIVGKLLSDILFTHFPPYYVRYPVRYPVLFIGYPVLFGGSLKTMNKIKTKKKICKIENISKINYAMGKYQIGWVAKCRIKSERWQK